MERRLKKKRGHTLYQPCALFITVRMRTTMSAAYVSGNHGQLFRPCWASSVWHSRYLPRLVASNPSKRHFGVLDFVLKQNLKRIIEILFQFSFKIYSNLFLSLIISVFQYVRPQSLKQLFLLQFRPQAL